MLPLFWTRIRWMSFAFVLFLFTAVRSAAALTPSPGLSDTTPLTITINSPADNATLPANSSVCVNATVTDNVALQQVVMLWNKNGVTTSMPCPSSTANWTCTVSGNSFNWSVNVDSGDRTFQIKATDTANNVSTSPQRTIHI